MIPLNGEMGDDAETIEEPLSPEELSSRTGLAPSFFRSGLEAGCPAVDGKIRHRDLLVWLLEHHPLLRSRLGLKALPPTLDQTTRVGNVLLTISDYIAMRSSSLEMQRVARVISRRLTRRLRTRAAHRQQSSASAKSAEQT